MIEQPRLLGGPLNLERNDFPWDLAFYPFPFALQPLTLKLLALPGWMAIGDAALAFDPSSSQGLFNALYFGLAAADGARFMHGDEIAINEYAAETRSVLAA